MVDEHFQTFVEEYRLTEEEQEIITLSIDRYTNAVEQYHLFNVGFEKDEEKKVQLILEYHLDEDEVEEAFFMPLKFNQKALIGRDSELYRRRVVIKNLTVSWSYLSDAEKEAKKTQHHLTDEEMKYIETTRKTIDRIKEKVFQK